MPSIRAQLYAAFLRRSRDRGLTITALAEAVGEDRGNMSRKLQKEGHGFDVEQAERVADYLECTIVRPPRRRRAPKASAGARA